MNFPIKRFFGTFNVVPVNGDKNMCLVTENFNSSYVENVDTKIYMTGYVFTLDGSIVR